MNTETQNLIVSILGLYAILSLIGIVFLASFAIHDNEIILALVPVTTTPVSILGGFIAGKTIAEKQEEIYEKQINSQEIDENNKESIEANPVEEGGA